MHRFFVEDTSCQTDLVVDISTLSHQLLRVLRLRVGDEIILLDNQGFEYRTTIERLETSAATGRILEQTACAGEPSIALTLFQCALKGDRMEWVLQKGTELGVSAFVPVISERTVVRPASAIERKYERWHSIVREAAEQCGRGKLPLLLPPLSWQQAVQQANESVRLVPWEEAANTASFTAIVKDSFGIGQAVRNVSLLIGPEGGISAEEVASAQEFGWRTVTLGPRILRAETAAIVSITALMLTLGEMG